MWQIRVRRMREVHGYEQRAITEFFLSAARNERNNKMLGSVGCPIHVHFHDYFRRRAPPRESGGYAVLIFPVYPMDVTPIVVVTASRRMCGIIFWIQEIIVPKHTCVSKALHTAVRRVPRRKDCHDVSDFRRQ